MKKERIFVGRKKELELWLKVLEDPQGQAVLVAGQSAMGKTWLVDKMAEVAQNHPQLKCGYVRYEVTPTDSPDSKMALMMDNAFGAAQVKEGSFDGTTRSIEQWRSLLNVFNLGNLLMSLRRDPTKDTREQFHERLNLISEKMPENGRAIFVIDPEKYMCKDSDQSWAIVVKKLPYKVKFVFAQRTDDMLIDSETFEELKNVVLIPDGRLDVLDEQAVDDLVNIRAKQIGQDVRNLRKVIARYNGHPYAIDAALNLVEAGTKLEELPQKAEPVKFAKAQWKKVCEKGTEAVRLFEAYAILEVDIPSDVVEAVSKLAGTERKCLENDKFLGALLREEENGKRIYHSILADYILGQINESEEIKYRYDSIEAHEALFVKSDGIIKIEGTNEKTDNLKRMSLHCTKLQQIYERQEQIYEAENDRIKVKDILIKIEDILRRQLKIQKEIKCLTKADIKVLLGWLLQKKGEYSKAYNHWERVRVRYNRIGMPNEAKTVKKWMEELNQEEVGKKQKSEKLKGKIKNKHRTLNIQHRTRNKQIKETRRGKRR